MGALLAHVTKGAEAASFQPMNVNFGLFPPLPAAGKGRRGKRDRARAHSDRAKAAALAWWAAPLAPGAAAPALAR